MNQGYVLSQISDGVCTISFFHPAHNSLPAYLLRELSIKIEEAGHSPDVHLIVLRSEGEKTFCAGASFDELVRIENESQGLEFFSGFARVINSMRKCPKIIVARVHGRAIGGGVGLAAASDYALSCDWGTIRLSELAVGIGPFVIGPVVQRKIGISAFTQLSLTPADWQTAEWAKSKGLYQEVFENVEKLDNYLKNFINQLKGYNPEALSELKKIFWEGTEDWDSLLTNRAAISGRLILSPFSKNEIARFKQKSNS